MNKSINTQITDKIITSLKLINIDMNVEDDNFCIFKFTIKGINYNVTHIYTDLIVKDNVTGTLKIIGTVGTGKSTWMDHKTRNIQIYNDITKIIQVYSDLIKGYELDGRGNRKTNNE